MNRIILIGNGFDLAHGLETKYKDFIEWVWKRLINKIDEVLNTNQLYEGYLLEVSTHSGLIGTSLKFDSAINIFEDYCGESLRKLNYQGLQKALLEFNKKHNNIKYSIFVKFKNSFLESLLKSHSNKEWVDIEEEYYRKLRKLSLEYNYDDIESIKILNQELEQIKYLLDKYLQSVASHSQKMPEFEQLIYSPFMKSDFIDDTPIRNILSPILDNIKDSFKKEPINDNTSFLYDYISDYYLSKYHRFFYYNDWDYIKKYSLDEIISDPNEQEFINHCAVPNDILFLNFNYTPTAKYYAETDVSIRDGKKQNFKVNHIHGELNQKEKSDSNPIIFGYGDEISEEYKQLENLNDNTLLENVKSIRYLEADNYRNLMSFIESEEYQIYIMGHSCGISDRTLLSTLFEHENCVSIKPFYYKWTDKKGQQHDNYREIVQNISRNFGYKIMMRNKVVNKVHCLPLPQKTK